MNEPERMKNGLISSLDILDRTGISRATLNNYIKMGILPRPIVRKPESLSVKARQVGYFPASVLEVLLKIKQYKSQGYSMDEICAHMGSQPISLSGTSEIADHFGDDGSTPRIPDRRKDGDLDPVGASHTEMPGDVRLTINDIHCPAYLINFNFEIEWINAEAQEAIFGQDIQSIKIAECRNVFRLFFGMGLLSPPENRHPIVDYHMSLYRQKFAKNELENLYPGITPKEVRVLSGLYNTLDQTDSSPIRETYLDLNFQNDSETLYRAYHIEFREGILCVYLPADRMMQGVVDLLSSRGKIIQDLLRQRMPTLVSFSVLVADLQDSVRICAELPPEDYFRLINQIWKSMEGIFRKYYGTYGKHTGDGMVYYFLKERDSNYLMNALHCALELRENMKLLSHEWKTAKGWFNDLFLNVGINEGQEYFGTIPASPTIEFTALGDSVNYAGRLSDLARYGSIWTTKNLINRLSDEEKKSVCYGIRKQDQNREVLIETIFSRVIDLMPPDSTKYSKFMDIANLPVTEILRIR
jgi:class 3 adenylate cyclase/predicted DNA-binding transcriptional regulator AlpA